MTYDGSLAGLQTLAITFIVTICVLGVTLVYLIFFLMKDRDKSRYDLVEHRAFLSDMRASYEANIARIVSDMTATQARWMDANHLVISGQNFAGRNEEILFSNFLRNAGLQKEELEISEKLVLFLTPFTNDELGTFVVAQDVCASFNLDCVRGDEEQAIGDVLTHVLKLIVKSRFVIANIGSRNPNVFYELGIAQALGKQTILISKRLDGVPFDLRNERIITFTDGRDLFAKLGTAVSAIVKPKTNTVFSE